MTVQSATADPRFGRVSLQEGPTVEIEISVLSPLRRISSVAELTRGQHGLYVRRGRQAGLLLPKAWQELGGSAEEFARHTVSKAGLPDDAWRSTDAQLFDFETEVFSQDPPPAVLFLCRKEACSVQAAQLAEHLGKGWLRTTFSTDSPGVFAGIEFDFAFSLGCTEALHRAKARQKATWEWDEQVPSAGVLLKERIQVLLELVRREYAKL